MECFVNKEWRWFSVKKLKRLHQALYIVYKFTHDLTVKTTIVILIMTTLETSLKKMSYKDVL